MNNKTFFKQHNKERFIILVGVKGVRVWKYPFGVAGQYVGPWFVGSVCEASSSWCRWSLCWSLVCRKRVWSLQQRAEGSKWNQWQSCERDVFLLQAEGSLTLSVLPKGTRKIVPERKKDLMHSASWLVSERPNLLAGALICKRK